MEDILILAGSDQELIDRYLDKEKDATDYAQLKELEEKHGRDYGLTDIVYAQLKRKLFQRALKNFVLRVCQEQRDLCEQGFWEAECGDEAEFICQAPMPDLVTDIEEYERMCRWWHDLDDETRFDLATVFEGEFGPIRYDEDTIETQDRICNCWMALPLKDKLRIYHCITED